MTSAATRTADRCLKPSGGGTRERWTPPWSWDGSSPSATRPASAHEDSTGRKEDNASADGTPNASATSATTSATVLSPSRQRHRTEDTGSRAAATPRPRTTTRSSTRVQAASRRARVVGSTTTAEGTGDAGAMRPIAGQTVGVWLRGMLTSTVCGTARSTCDRRRRDQRRRVRSSPRRARGTGGPRRPLRLRQRHEPGVVQPGVGRLQVPGELRVPAGLEPLPLPQPPDEGVPGQHQGDQLPGHAGPEFAVRALVLGAGRSRVLGHRPVRHPLPRCSVRNASPPRSPSSTSPRRAVASSTATPTSSTTTRGSCSRSSDPRSRPAPRPPTTSSWCPPNARVSAGWRACATSTAARSSPPRRRSSSTRPVRTWTD